MDNIEIKKAGATVVLEQIRKQNEVFQFGLRVRYDDAAGALQSHRARQIVNQGSGVIIDAKGQEVEDGGGI